MNERLRFNPTEAAAAGEADANSLLLALGNVADGDSPAGLLNDALAEIIGLAAENRIEECSARLEAFGGVLGPVLYQAASAAEQLEALRAKCALLAASLAQAEATNTERG